MKRRKTVSRTLEFILGIVGSVLGIFSGSFLIFFVIVGADHINVISALFLLSAGILTLFRK